MCGRFSFAEVKKESLKKFGVQKVYKQTKFSFNISPGMQVPVILDQNTSLLTTAHWGFSILQPNSKVKMINARSETAGEKPLFQNAFQNNRCLVLADSFYEWSENKEEKKQPYRIRLKKEPLFAMAALWKKSKVVAGGIECVILTKPADQNLHSIHHRMPVMLSPNSSQDWLKQVNDDLLFQTCLEEQLICEKISKLVNVTSNNSRALWMTEKKLDKL